MEKKGEVWEQLGASLEKLIRKRGGGMENTGNKKASES